MPRLRKPRPWLPPSVCSSDSSSLANMGSEITNTWTPRKIDKTDQHGRQSATVYIFQRLRPAAWKKMTENCHYDHVPAMACEQFYKRRVSGWRRPMEGTRQPDLKKSFHHGPKQKPHCNSWQSKPGVVFFKSLFFLTFKNLLVPSREWGNDP